MIPPVRAGCPSAGGRPPRFYAGRAVGCLGHRSHGNIRDRADAFDDLTIREDIKPGQRSRHGILAYLDAVGESETTEAEIRVLQAIEERLDAVTFVAD